MENESNPNLKPHQSMAEPEAKSIRFKEFDFAGFAATAKLPGQQIQILVEASLTSDEPSFHVYANGLNGSLRHHMNLAGAIGDPSRASTIVLVCHQDRTADLYLDAVGIRVEIRAKRDVQAGEPVFEQDIADVRAMGFVGVSIQPSDRIMVLFREGWKFGMYFDLRTERDLDLKQIERKLGASSGVSNTKISMTL